MAAEIGWLDGEDHVRRLLREAHRARHNAGREETIRRLAEVDRLREAGQHARADKLEERTWKKSVQFTRRKRQREHLEAASDLRKLGAALRREERKLFKRQPHAALFRQFEAPDRVERSGLRDLYCDYIPRGFSSGNKREYTREKKRASSRTTPWKSGEMGRKVRYILREDALEPVDGNVLTNMGADIVEAVACCRILEDIEKLARAKNGGVYHHVIIGFPCHLTAEERALLLSELTRPLREMKLPYCAALHKPDRRGDQRNYHAHIVVNLRPMERVAEYQWEFLPSKRTWLDTTAGLHLQRKFVARTINRALAAAGHDVRWTAKSRRDRGEESPGDNKKGPERTRVERDARDAAEARRQTRRQLYEVNALSRDLTSLDRVAAILDETVSPLHDCVTTTVQELRALGDQCEGEARALQALPVPIDLSTIKDGGWERTIETRECITDEKAGDIIDRPRTVGEEQANPSWFIADQEPPRRTKKRAKTPANPFSLAEVDASAIAKMGEQGRPDVSAFQRLRKAVVAGQILRQRVEHGRYRVLSKDEGILVDLATVLRSDEGGSYFRAVIDSLPSAPLDLAGWKGRNLRYKELEAQKAGAKSPTITVPEHDAVRRQAEGLAPRKVPSEHASAQQYGPVGAPETDDIPAEVLLRMQNARGRGPGQ